MSKHLFHKRHLLFGVFSLNVFQLSTAPRNVVQTISFWENKFICNDIPDPKSSIKNIVAHVLKVEKIPDLYLQLDHALTLKQEEEVEKLCECRLARMPLQYIIREWEFRDLKLKMCPPVFIPRPETEMLVDIVLENSGPIDSLLEVGCGSGAISLALLKQCPNLQCIALDQSKVAVQLTKENAALHGLTERIDVLRCKLLDDGNTSLPLPFEQINTIVSNPPYVPMMDLRHLQPEIQIYEDLRALDGGGDGLRVVKALMILASRLLSCGGNLFMEVDPTHPQLIDAWLTHNKQIGLTLQTTYQDFAKLDRFVQLKRMRTSHSLYQ